MKRYNVLKEASRKRPFGHERITATATTKLRKQKGEGRRRIGYLEEETLFQAYMTLGGKNADRLRERMRRSNIDGFCRRQSR